MNALPKVKVKLDNIPNPNWVAVANSGGAVDMTGYYLSQVEIEVEVLQLNLNSGGMRVRFGWPDRDSGKIKVHSRDIDIEHFFAAYEIKQKQ